MKILKTTVATLSVIMLASGCDFSEDPKVIQQRIDFTKEAAKDCDSPYPIMCNFARKEKLGQTNIRTFAAVDDTPVFEVIRCAYFSQNKFDGRFNKKLASQNMRENDELHSYQWWCNAQNKKCSYCVISAFKKYARHVDYHVPDHLDGSSYSLWR